MKIAELRQRLDGHTTEQLRALAILLYRALPKALREQRQIDACIEQPETVAGRATRRPAMELSFDDVADDARRFMALAHEQKYFAPNREVPKKERSGWRFVVKQLTRDLQTVAVYPESQTDAAQLLGEMYALLCRACAVVLFSSDEPFTAIGIDQPDYLRKVLTLKNRCCEKPAFIREALDLMVTNRGNSCGDVLIFVLLEFLPLPDHKNEAIAAAKKMITSRPPVRLNDHDGMRQYYAGKRHNDLVEVVFHCYAALAEWQNAMDWFNARFRDHDDEVKLYWLVCMLRQRYRRNDLAREQIAVARVRGVVPRETLLTFEQTIDADA